MVLIEMNANAKLGSNYITHDSHAISDNGKLLRDLLQRQNLTCLNSHELCEGTITRHRKTILGDEKAVLDFMIACDQLTPYLERMVVDEKRVNILTKYATSKGVRIKSESDHNPLYAEFNLRFSRGKSAIRREIFDFKNQESLDKFSEITNNSEKLRTCFKGNVSTKAATDKFFKTLNDTFHVAFKKIRIRTSRTFSSKPRGTIQENLSLKTDLEKIIKNSAS